MDRQGVETNVLSVLGTFCWIEAAGGSTGAGMSPSQPVKVRQNKI